MKSAKILKKLLLLILFVTVFVIIDQYTKKMADTYLASIGSYPIINNVLEFYYLPGGNTGAAFGMFKGGQAYFCIIAGVISIFLTILFICMPDNKKYNILKLLIVLIISGGIGNMIDRIFLGSVIDFIYIKAIDFPIFNVADMYVSISMVVLIILFIFYYKEEDLKEIEDSVKNLFK